MYISVINYSKADLRIFRKTFAIVNLIDKYFFCFDEYNFLSNLDDIAGQC